MARNFCADQARPRAEVLAQLRRELAATAPKELGGKAPLPTGIPVIDEALQGGLPRGKIVEVNGVGRMSVALSALAGATAQGLHTAFLDTVDAFDPQAAHVAGVELSRVLWVRLPSKEPALKATDLILSAGGFGLLVLYLDGHLPPWPPQTWVRLVQRSEHAGTALLVLSDQPAAGSYSIAALRGVGQGADWLRAPGGRLVFKGRSVHFEVVRSRLGPPGMAGAVGFRK